MKRDGSFGSMCALACLFACGSTKGQSSFDPAPADPGTDAGTSFTNDAALLGEASTFGGGGGGTDGSTTTQSCKPAQVAAPGACTALGITIAPEFAATYSCVDLGTLTAIPSPWGGFAMSFDDPSSILVTGSARSADGRLYNVPLGRDAQCHIAGFTGASTNIAEAPYNEAGVAVGPKGVLFLAQAVINKLGQLKPGSKTTDKTIDMTPFGIDTSMCGVGFVPSGFGAAGQLKLVNWPTPGSWYSAVFAPDANGTYDISTVTKGPALPDGAAGFVFIAAGSPKFTTNTVLVSDYDTGNVVAYELDAQSNPIVATSKPFITGLTGAQGGVVDPVSGDFLFSTFESARIIDIRGFKPPPPPPPPPK